jgi:hypothetical protein
MKRLYELTLGLADGRLAPVEEAELARLIDGDPIARQRHLELLEIEAALRASVAGPSLRGEHTVKVVLQAIGGRQGTPLLQRGLRWAEPRVPMLGAVAACAALVFLGYALAERARPGPASAAGRPEGAGGFASRPPGRRARGSEVPAARAVAGRAGNPVSLRGLRAGPGGWVGSPLRLRLGSASEVARFELAGGGVVEARGARVDATLEHREDSGPGPTERLVVEEGTVALDGNRVDDPGAEIVVVTPHAEVLARVRHAVIAVSATGTELDVHDGTALAGPVGEGRRTEIGSGQGMSVSSTGALAVHQLPAVLFVGGSHFGRFPTDVLERALVRRFEGNGFAVEVVDEAALEEGMVAGKALVFISPSASELLEARVREIGLGRAPVPIICARPSVYADLGMTGPGRQNAAFTGGATRVEIIASGHPLAAGLIGPQQVTRAPGTFGWGLPGSQALRVAVFPDWRKSERASIFAYERGAELASAGVHSPARRVGFFLHPDLGPYLTEAGWALFDASVKWATGR